MDPSLNHLKISEDGTWTSLKCPVSPLIPTAFSHSPGHDNVHHKDVATPGGNHAEVRQGRQHRPGPGAIAA